MKIEDLLMIVIVGGFTLTVWYIAAEVVSFKVLRAVDLAALLSARELYKRLHSVTKPLIIKAMYRRK
jgi:hypothetical protein